MLTQSKDRLSNDRLRRVQGGSNANACRRLDFAEKNKSHTIDMLRNDQIRIGDWCLFEWLTEAAETVFLLGSVLGFQYIKGKTAREKKLHVGFCSS